MHILVTGAAGFLGKECVDHFIRSGHTVVTTDLRGDVDLKGDLSKASFTESLPKVDVLIHCAAVQYVTPNIPFFFRKEFFIKNNVEVTKNICKRYKGSGTHVINIGTSMMYCQGGDTSYDIDNMMLGEGVYSQSKVEAQKFINEIENSATIIPCIIGGKGREGLFKNFVKLMQKYGVVIYPGKGHQLTSMVHVYDVASLAVLIAHKKASGFFNAAAKNPLSISQWVDEIAEELSLAKVIKITLPLKLTQFISIISGYRILAREQILMLKYPHVLSIHRTLLLGWQPKYTNKEIVRDIARSIARR